jgi:creatinine amidohydrolase
MLHLAPELVGKERPAGATEPLVAIKDALMSGGVRHVSPNGVLGDAAGASADEGRQIFAKLVDDLEQFLTQP